MSDQFDLDSLLQQAMALQQQLAQAQDEARQRTVEGTAGGGLVRITLTGAGDPVAVAISPQAIDTDDPTMLDDLVLAALRDATSKVHQLQSDAMGPLGDTGLGGLLGG